MLKTKTCIYFWVWPWARARAGTWAPTPAPHPPLIKKQIIHYITYRFRAFWENTFPPPHIEKQTRIPACNSAYKVIQFIYSFIYYLLILPIGLPIELPIGLPIALLSAHEGYDRCQMRARGAVGRPLVTQPWEQKYPGRKTCCCPTRE